MWNGEQLRERKGYWIGLCVSFLFYTSSIAYGNELLIRSGTDVLTANWPVVYDQSACKTNNTTIEFEWLISGTDAPLLLAPGGSGVKFELLLGSDNGPVLFSKLIPQAELTIETLENGQALVGKYEGATAKDVELQNQSYGFVNDGRLMVQELIAYEQSQLGTTEVVLEDVCSLKEPGNSGERSIRLIGKVSYSVQGQGTGVSEDRIRTKEFQIRYDLTPPIAPINLSTTGSEKSLIVNWESSEDNAFYTVFYNTSSIADPSEGQEIKAIAGCSNVAALSCKINNLVNGTNYFIRVQAFDEARNPSTLSEEITGTPLDLQDFFEGYMSSGGEQKGFDSGTYCFIATAAYDHYDHRYVKILRDFRDQYLLPHSAGRAFVNWYYKHSPAWARWLRQSPIAKTAVRWSLLPVIGMAAFFVRLSVWFKLISVLVLFAFVVLIRRSRKSRHFLFFCVATTCALFYTVPKGYAEGSPRHFGFELRAGPYSPQIDGETATTMEQKPYETIFGTGPQMYLGVGFEWLVFKGFGSIGLGGNVGFSWRTGTAIPPNASGGTSSDATTQSDNVTGLWIVPSQLDLSYRFDYFVQYFPVVPYVRGGVDYSLWWITDTNGNVATSINQGTTSTAIGGRLGYHFGAGVQFLLDVADRESAKTFDVEFGVNHSYIFVEYSYLGMITPGLNLSDPYSIRAGLMFQF